MSIYTMTISNDTTITTLRANLRGELLTPKDADYDEARRIWNALIDRRPALIARCTGVVDVIEAVTFARAQKIPISGCY